MKRKIYELEGKKHAKQKGYDKNEEEKKKRNKNNRVK